VILLILIIIFSFQNMGIITVKLFNWSLSLPTAIVIILAYILGMMTGGMLVSLLKTLISSTVPEVDK
jgi:lipopolysaccharide assembly protein A